jgi:hypothetical protein
MPQSFAMLLHNTTGDSRIDYCRLSDLPELELFFQRQYAPDYILASPRYYHWQFFQPPANKEKDHCLSLLLRYHGSIIGHLGVVPVDLNTGTPGVFLINWIMARKYRQSGLGISLTEEAQRRYGRLLATGYGPQVEPAYRYLKWRILPPLKRWVAVLDPTAAADLAGDPRVRDAYPVLKVRYREEVFSEQVDWLADPRLRRGIFHHGTAVDYTPEYLNWRYINHPALKYEILTVRDQAFLVRRRAKHHPVLRIVDFGGTLPALRRLINTTLAAAVRENAAFVDVFYSGDRYDELFRETGFCDPRGKPPLPMLFAPLDRSRDRVTCAAYPAAGTKGEIFLTRGGGDQDRATTTSDLFQKP